MTVMKYLPDVVTLELDVEKCTGCGMCVVVCPHKVFEIENRKSKIVDRDACMECGACAMNCEFGAISVESGVGCAAGVIIGAIRGTEPTCGCDSSPGSGYCG
jgi:ferredoxin